MRQAVATKPEFLFDQNNNLVGILLGGDYCAEHEFGIGRLSDAFQVKGDQLGIERLRIHAVPPLFVQRGQYNRQKAVLIIYDPYFRDTEKTIRSRAANYNLAVMPEYDINGLAAAWDDKSFGLLAVGKPAILYAEQLLEDLQKKPFYLWTNSHGPFGSISLSLASEDFFSEEDKREAYERDLDHQKLMKAVKKTKIIEKLKKAGLGWHALAPNWNFFEPPIKTKYPVVFFLESNAAGSL